MRLNVKSLFGVASLQGFGHPGYRQFGVPKGGAFDRESLQLANALLNNAPGATAIEFALGTLELEVLEPGSLAVVGATAGALVDGAAQPLQSAFVCKEGSTVTVLPPVNGLRTYIALAGGVGAPKETLVTNTLDAGDVLVSSEDRSTTARHLAQSPTSLRNSRLRVLVLRDEGEWFDKEFMVGRNIDRTGLRLDGPKPELEAKSGTSEPSAMGAVQLTEDHTLIVHGPDGPTIGGYIKLGCVASADHDRLGQLAPGERIEFEPVSLDSARALYAESLKEQREVLRKLALAAGGSL